MHQIDMCGRDMNQHKMFTNGPMASTKSWPARHNSRQKMTGYDEMTFRTRSKPSSGDVVAQLNKALDALEARGFVDVEEDYLATLGPIDRPPTPPPHRELPNESRLPDTDETPEYDDPRTPPTPSSLVLPQAMHPQTYIGPGGYYHLDPLGPPDSYIFEPFEDIYLHPDAPPNITQGATRPTTPDLYHPLPPIPTERESDFDRLRALLCEFYNLNEELDRAAWGGLVPPDHAERRREAGEQVTRLARRVETWGADYLRDSDVKGVAMEEVLRFHADVWDLVRKKKEMNILAWNMEEAQKADGFDGAERVVEGCGGEWAVVRKLRKIEELEKRIERVAAWVEGLTRWEGGEEGKESKGQNGKPWVLADDDSDLSTTDDEWDFADSLISDAELEERCMAVPGSLTGGLGEWVCPPKTPSRFRGIWAHIRRKGHPMPDVKLERAAHVRRQHA